MAGLLEILIDGSPLDLFPEAEKDFYITRQVNDLTNLQSRKADFTKSIQIPVTPTNRALLADSFTNYEQSRRVACIIKLNGTTVVTSGQLIVFNVNVLKQTPVTAEIVIFYGNFNFFDLIDGPLSGLDWSDLNMTWDATSVEGIKDTTDICFPRCDWYNISSYLETGASELNSKQDINSSGFVIFFKEVITRIAAKAGFTIDDSALNAGSLWFTLGLACKMDKFFDLNTIPGAAQSDVLNTSSQSTFNILSRVEYNSIVFDTGSPGTIWNTTNDEWTIQTTGVYAYRLYGIATLGSTNSNRTGTITIKVNGGVVATYILVGGQGTIIGGSTVEEIDLSFTSALSVSDVVHADFITNHAATSLQISANSRFYLAEVGSVDTSRDIIISDYLPNIDNKTFLNGVLAHLGIFMQTDDLEKTVFFNEINDLVTTEEQNWSDNLDISQNITFDNFIDGYFRQNNVKYASDDSLFQPDEFNSLFNIPDDVLEREGDVITLPYSPCDEVTFRLVGGGADPALGDMANVPLVTIALKEAFTYDGPVVVGDQTTVDFGTHEHGLRAGDQITVGTAGPYFIRVESVVDINTITIANATSFQKGASLITSYTLTHATSGIRIVNLKLETTTDATYNIFNGWSNDLTAMDQPFYDATSDITEIGFEAILTSSYLNWIAALQTAQTVQAFFVFDLQEFLDIDFLRPVYVEDLNGFFYINRIEQFKLNQPVRVDLIRVNSLI